MKLNRLALALTVINLILLLFILTQRRMMAPYTEATLLRVHALELVDDNGVVRAQLNSYPDGGVVFRLKDAQGTIRVKLGADEEGSGLVLANDQTEPGIHMLANQYGTAITLTEKSGVQQVIAP
ncbi:MAG: hypothetical protein IT330_15165 [Anaerolineae bacterium]|nr:hypothetical protein [Anaerolineae bacterium]